MINSAKFRKMWSWVLGLGALFGLATALAQLVDIKNESLLLHNKLEILKSDNEKLKLDNQRLYSILESMVTSGVLGLNALAPFITPSAVSEVTSKTVHVQRKLLPLDLNTRFYPSGWMGDGIYGDKYISFKYQPVVIHNSETFAVKISYKQGPKGWAGIYWQYPDKNWGGLPGRNLIGAEKITFFARGEHGGEIVEFKSGGIKGEYSDSYEVSLGKVVLEKGWGEFTIDLSKVDLSSVVGGFAWIVSAKDNNNREISTYISSMKLQ